MPSNLGSRRGAGITQQGEPGRSLGTGEFGAQLIVLQRKDLKSSGSTGQRSALAAPHNDDSNWARVVGAGNFADWHPTPSPRQRRNP